MEHFVRSFVVSPVGGVIHSAPSGGRSYQKCTYSPLPSGPILYPPPAPRFHAAAPPCSMHPLYLPFKNHPVAMVMYWPLSNRVEGFFYRA